jgi:2-polyprenyl-3-methyl-5-hydroxy-6-metoxy-1,4-benzoquinol methylase
MEQAYFEQNKKLWNAKVRFHLRSAFYDVAGFKAGANSLTEIELAELPDLKGKNLLHLQCHFGQDTLSLARLGATVTGVDFSEEAITAAQELSDELHIPARFLNANIYDLERSLDEKFEVVFTSYGAIPWLPDLNRWARLVSKYLEKGGIFLIAEFHPLLYLLNFDNGKIEYNYFKTEKPYEEIVAATYADSDAEIHETEYFWNHSFEEIIMSLVNAGLTLELFKEYDYSPFNCFSNMKEVAIRRYRYDLDGIQLPHVFLLKMRK